jgi:alkanesulfonate monooxygenase SsuD/methylene tetrahydromethanopterin reductase-like flavin-dependent oxidoreductase (luciferase family)
VGGSGPKKTLRTVARHADAWNTAGTLAEVAARDTILRAHCADVGRDPATIERTVSFPIVLRDDPADAASAFAAACAHNGTPDAGAVPTLLGPPRDVAAAIRPYVDLGFTTIIVRLPAPYDAETLARIGEVRTALAAASAPAA